MLKLEVLQIAGNRVRLGVDLAGHPGARLYRLAGFALHQEPFTTLDELLSRIDRVTEAEVAESAAEFFHPDRQCLLRLGP